MATHIRITARRDGFRRAGLVHSRQPADHPIGSLTQTQIDQIEADPALELEIVDLAEAVAAPADEDILLLGSNILPSDVELVGGATVPLGTIVMAAFQTSGLSRAAWNDQGDLEREARLETYIASWIAVGTAAYEHSTNSQGRSGTAREASSTSDGTQPAEPVSVGAQPAAHSSADTAQTGPDGATTAEDGAAATVAPSSSADPATGSDDPQGAEQGKDEKPVAPKPAGRKPAGKKAAAKGAGKS